MKTKTKKKYLINNKKSYTDEYVYKNVFARVEKKNV